MGESGVNPYQPTALPPAEIDDDSPQEVNFRLSHALVRHAEAQYLLHWHPRRLLFGSLAMIAASCVAIWWSLNLPTIVFLMVLLTLMVVCSAIYLALVHHAKLQIRRRQRDLGLQHAAACAAQLDQDSLRLTSPKGDFQWPIGGFRVYRTSKGLLLCPEPLLYIFVPKQDASREAFDLFRRRAESAR